MGIGWDSLLSIFAGLREFTWANALTNATLVTPTIASLFINKMGFQVIGVYAGIFSLIACVCGFFVHHGDAKPILNSAVNEAVSD